MISRSEVPSLVGWEAYGHPMNPEAVNGLNHAKTGSCLNPIGRPMVCCSLPRSSTCSIRLHSIAMLPISWPLSSMSEPFSPEKDREPSSSLLANELAPRSLLSDSRRSCWRASIGPKAAADLRPPTSARSRTAHGPGWTWTRLLLRLSSASPVAPHGLTCTSCHLRPPRDLRLLRCRSNLQQPRQPSRLFDLWRI